MTRKGLLVLSVLCLCVMTTAAQQKESAYVAARSNMAAYEDEADIMKTAYRESPYFMEFTGRWNQKQTDSSIIYSRSLDVEKFWRDYRVFLNVRCGRSCRVLLNGKEVGYSADSRLWGEFELNDFLKYGKKNTLEIEAMKHPKEASLERDDLGVGLNGEPYLLFKGDPNVADMTLTADYEAATATGTLTVDANIFCSKKKGKYYLEVEVWDPQGHTLDRMGRWVVFDKKSKTRVDLTRSWGGVEPWSAESPKLYTVVLRLRNEEMAEEEVVGARIGFRSVEVKDGLLMLNGKPLTIKGVTYGIEHTEGSVSRERIKQDLMTMKQNNINAVRTAKYSPMEPYFYQLCDEMGLYVICDANLMPVSNQRQVVATDKDFIPLFERRVENLYGKYKNHTSVIAWSLGESRDNGICMAAAYRHLKTIEKSRPVVFAGADHSENTDVIALMMPTEKTLRQSLEKVGDRPYIMLASVEESDFGMLEKIWSMVESRRTLQGGFVDAWPLPSSLLLDLKQIYSPFDVHLTKQTIDDAEFLVYNRNTFSNFSNYILEYTIYTNLRPSITAGDLPVAIEGGGVETVKLRMPPVDLLSGEEMFIRFDLEQRKSSMADPLVGTIAFPLPYKTRPKQQFVNKGMLMADSVDLDNPRFNYLPVLRFNKNWTSERVAVTRRSPDDGIVCVDALTQYMSAGRSMCDVRETYTFLGTGDVMAEYTLSPTDPIRGNLNPQLVVNLPQGEADTLVWFGLDRETCFQHGMGVPGTYSESRIKMTGATRQQVRWCAIQKGDQENLYVALLDAPFTMNIKEDKLILSPAADNKTIRVHLRKYVRDTANLRPEDFYGVDMPVVKTGIVDPPQIVASSPRFSQPLTVTLNTSSKGEIRYTLDGSEPTSSSTLYSSPFVLNTSTVVKARVFSKEMPPSFTATRKFNYDYIVKTSFSQRPNTPYNVGSDTLLFDGEKSVVENLMQGWIGFSGKGVSTTVELSKPIDIEYITLRYAHVPEMWAFAPQGIEVYLSENGKDYSDTVMVTVPIDPTSVDENHPQTVEIRVPINKQSIGFVRIDARSIGTVPSWHRAKGLNPWLLMDEIEVGEATQSNDKNP